MRHLLFIGNSHLLAVLDAALRLGGAAGEEARADPMWLSAGLHAYDIELPGPEPASARFILVGGVAPPLVRVDAFGLFSVRRRYLGELDDGVAHLDGRVDQVVSCFFGNEHSIFSLMEHPVPFDVFVGEADMRVDPEGPPRQVVPLDVLRRELATRANPTVLYCEILRSVFPEADVVHVMPPPPISDEEHIRARPELFVQLIEQYGVAPAALRRKVYELYADVLCDALTPSGVRLLPAPEDALDHGFLRRDLWMESTHANHGYGRLVLEQLGAA